MCNPFCWENAISPAARTLNFLVLKASIFIHKSICISTPVGCLIGANLYFVGYICRGSFGTISKSNEVVT